MNPTIPSGTELRTKALERVKGYVCKDRQATHGDAEDNFRQIAAYWALYKGYPFTPGDVAAMMALVKIARMKTSPDYVDNWDDLAGYAICGAGLADKKRMSEQPKEAVEPVNVLNHAKCPQCHHKIFFDLTPHWHTPPNEVIETCPKCDTKFRPLVP